MMTKMQPEKNTFPPIHVLYPFPCDDVDIAPHGSADGHQAWDCQMKADSMESAEPADDSLPVVTGLPLWPSLTEIRATMGKNYPWQEEMDQALAVRSVLISAATIGMCAIGLLLVF